jgi:hypothetical protein
MKLIGEETSLKVYPSNTGRTKEALSDKHFYGKNDLSDIELKGYTEERFNNEANTVFMMPSYDTPTGVSTFQVGDTRYLMPNTDIMDYHFSNRDDITPIIQEFMLDLLNETDKDFIKNHRDRTIRDNIVHIIAQKGIRVSAFYFFAFKSKEFNDIFDVFIKNPLRFISKGVIAKLPSYVGDTPLFDEAALVKLRSNSITYSKLIGSPNLLLEFLSKGYLPESGNVHYLKLFLDLQKSYGGFSYHIRNTYSSMDNMEDYSGDVDRVIGVQRHGGSGYNSIMKELTEKYGIDVTTLDLHRMTVDSVMRATNTLKRYNILGNATLDVEII